MDTNRSHSLHTQCNCNHARSAHSLTHSPIHANRRRPSANGEPLACRGRGSVCRPQPNVHVIQRKWWLTCLGVPYCTHRGSYHCQHHQHRGGCCCIFVLPPQMGQRSKAPRYSAETRKKRTSYVAFSSSWVFRRYLIVIGGVSSAAYTTTTPF